MPQNPGEECKTESWTSPVEKCHNRIEKRRVTVAPCDWFQDRELWSGLSQFVRVVRTTTTGDKTTTDERFYISSLGKTAEEYCTLIRGHWSIENQLHWCLDVIFGEDASCARKDNSPLNLNVLRKTALSLLKASDLGKRISLQKKRYRAALNPDVLSSILCKKPMMLPCGLLLCALTGNLLLDTIEKERIRTGGLGMIIYSQLTWRISKRASSKER